MTTAAARLVELAGHGGTAGALLLAIGSGATAGAALVAYSGLASGTAAEHLLVDVEQIDVTSARTGGSGAVRGDDDLVRQVLDKWEAIDAARLALIEAGTDVAVSPLFESQESSAGNDFGTGTQIVGLLAKPSAFGIGRPEAGAPLSPDAAAVALAAKRRQDDEALLMILAALD